MLERKARHHPGHKAQSVLRLDQRAAVMTAGRRQALQGGCP